MDTYRLSVCCVSCTELYAMRECGRCCIPTPAMDAYWHTSGQEDGQSVPVHVFQAGRPQSQLLSIRFGSMGGLWCAGLHSLVSIA